METDVRKGCYICRPDEPVEGLEDPCDECEASWVAYYYAAYPPAEEPGFGFIDNTVIADDGTTHRWCDTHRTYHPEGGECLAMVQSDGSSTTEGDD